MNTHYLAGTVDYLVERLHERLGFVGRVQIEFDEIYMAYNFRWQVFDLTCFTSLSIANINNWSPDRILSYIESRFRSEEHGLR